MRCHLRQIVPIGRYLKPCDVKPENPHGRQKRPVQLVLKRLRLSSRHLAPYDSHAIRRPFKSPPSRSSRLGEPGPQTIGPHRLPGRSPRSNPGQRVERTAAASDASLRVHPAQAPQSGNGVGQFMAVVPENLKWLKSLTMWTGVIIFERGLPSPFHRSG